MPTFCACSCGGRVQFSGCFKPGHQPVGTSRDPSGKIKASSDFWNPINNAKVQQRAREEHVERIAQFSPFEKPMTWADAVALAQEIMESVGPNTMGVMVEEFININCSTKSFPFYLGYTAQCLVDSSRRLS